MSGQSGCSLTKHPFLKESLKKAYPTTHPTTPFDPFVDWTKKLSQESKLHGIQKILSMYI